MTHGKDSTNTGFRNHLPLYLNNAATSFPKPSVVTEAIVHALSMAPEDPGRGHGGSNDVFACRQRLAEFFGTKDARQVCFAASGTDALNTAICGTLRPNDEVVTTAFDHNSVARPLAHLSRTRNVTVRRVGLDETGNVDLGELQNAITPRTRAVIVTHVSNVTGAIVPLDRVLELVSRHNITAIVDASQSAGLLPLHVGDLPARTIVAAAAHKGLYGPTGTGILLAPDEHIAQRVHGGTGVRSENTDHPTELPLRHEAGTLNHPGIAGLCAGVGYVRDTGWAKLAERRNELVHATREGLRRLNHIELSPLPNDDGRAGIVSFRVQGLPSEEVGFTLHEAFSIQVRTGLHCAPHVHRALDTHQHGLVRASFGAFNRLEHVEALVEAMTRILARR